MKTKRCPHCKTTKLLILFAKDRTKRIGYDVYCMACRKIKRKEYTLNYNSDNNEGSRKQNIWKFGNKFGKEKVSSSGYKNFKNM